MINVQSAEFRFKKISSIVNFTQVTQTICSQGESPNMELTSSGLADYYGKKISSRKENNYLILENGSIWKYTGDGKCIDPNKCSLKIDINGTKKPNKDMEDIAILRLQKYEQNGCLQINKEDIYKYLKKENK